MVWCASASANCASRAKERDSTEEEEAADRSLSALERCGGSSASSAAGKSALQSTMSAAKLDSEPSPSTIRTPVAAAPLSPASPASWETSTRVTATPARLAEISPRSAEAGPAARPTSRARAGSHPHADLLALLEKPPPHTPEPAPRIANAIRRGVQLHRLQQRDDARLAETSPRSAGIGPPSPAAARRLRAPRMATGRRTGPGRRAARGPCPRLGSSGGAAACAIGPRAGWRGSCGAPTSQRRAGRTRPS
mmetsp:Transcript_33092/g.104125  ORF Transcript_33092/g.104125 Transcript_33092/m.104125 type:complete len:251 (+) Transcript_33092:1006-1758(+)